MRKLGHREKSGVPNGTHSYVEARDTWEHVASGVRGGGVKLSRGVGGTHSGGVRNHRYFATYSAPSSMQVVTA